MNKAQLINFIMQSQEVEKKVAAEQVRNVLNAILNGLNNDGVVALNNFGTFSVVFRKGYQGYNPITGEPVPVIDKVVPKFRSGKTMKEIANNHLNRNIQDNSLKEIEDYENEE
jgi:nucleoid DNA-binding protein